MAMDSYIVGILIGLVLGGVWGYHLGWSEGWDESKKFTYETLDMMDDSGVLLTVRTMSDEFRKEGDGNETD